MTPSFETRRVRACPDGGSFNGNMNYGTYLTNHDGHLLVNGASL